MPVRRAARIALAASVLAQSGAITGEYMEDRTMRVYACPCEWSTDWAHRGREARCAIYVDKAGPVAQRSAGVHWLRSRYSRPLGRVVTLRALPISFFAGPAAITLDAGSVLTLRKHRTDLPAEARSWAELIHDPSIALCTSALATITQVRYTGRDLNIRWTREEDAITGYIGTFVDENRMEEF